MGATGLLGHPGTLRGNSGRGRGGVCDISDTTESVSWRVISPRKQSFRTARDAFRDARCRPLRIGEAPVSLYMTSTWPRSHIVTARSGIENNISREASTGGRFGGGDIFFVGNEKDSSSGLGASFQNGCRVRWRGGNLPDRALMVNWDLHHPRRGRDETWKWKLRLTARQFAKVTHSLHHKYAHEIFKN